jgi:hypothetical protein
MGVLGGGAQQRQQRRKVQQSTCHIDFWTWKFDKNADESDPKPT